LKYAFQLGAAAFLLAVIWTVFTTKEYPPEDMEAFEQMRREKKGLAAGLTEIITALREMPKTMRQLAPVQIFTWLGLFACGYSTCRRLRATSLARSIRSLRHTRTALSGAASRCRL